MKYGRLLLCVLSLALTLFATHASAAPYPPCSEVCGVTKPCTTRCSIWSSSGYTNVTCIHYGLCA